MAKVYYGELAKLRPKQLTEILEHNPIVYIPSGILEWHAEMNPLGTDTLKVEEIALRTARLTGGAVFMPSYIGAGAFYGEFSVESIGTGHGLKHGGVNFEEDFVRQYLLLVYEQLERFGFKLIVNLYGHTNEQNIRAHNDSAAEYMARPGTAAKILATDEVSTVCRYRYKKRDHAAKYETSFMMAKYPELVNFDEVFDGHDVWWGRDPRVEADAAVGEEMYTLIAQNLAVMVEKALTAEPEQLLTKNFAAGERCWERCTNYNDLVTGFWQGDEFWEDPCCTGCAWRSDGVVQALCDVRGFDWTAQLIEQWKIHRYDKRLVESWDHLNAELERLRK